jgi:hypothetical protein
VGGNVTNISPFCTQRRFAQTGDPVTMQQKASSELWKGREQFTVIKYNLGNKVYTMCVCVYASRNKVQNKAVLCNNVQNTNKFAEHNNSTS